MKPKLYVARHRETSWDAQDGDGEIIAGRSDIGLDAAGKKDADRLARKLSGKGLAGIYTSPTHRARQTADIISKKLDLPVQVSKDLEAPSYPELEGKKMGDVKDRLNEFRRHPEKKMGKGGESFGGFRDRTLRGFHSLSRKVKLGGKSLLAITHSRNDELLDDADLDNVAPVLK